MVLKATDWLLTPPVPLKATGWLLTPPIVIETMHRVTGLVAIFEFEFELITGQAAMAD